MRGRTYAKILLDTVKRCTCMMKSPLLHLSQEAKDWMGGELESLARRSAGNYRPSQGLQQSSSFGPGFLLARQPVPCLAWC